MLRPHLAWLLLHSSIDTLSMHTGHEVSDAVYYRSSPFKREWCLFALAATGKLASVLWGPFNCPL